MPEETGPRRLSRWRGVGWRHASLNFRLQKEEDVSRDGAGAGEGRRQNEECRMWTLKTMALARTLALPGKGNAEGRAFQLRIPDCGRYPCQWAAHGRHSGQHRRPVGPKTMNELIF